MRYRAFGDFRRGYAHVKNGSGVEDYAGACVDPQGRYYIGVICDGHSDRNCFRSGKGARFGCESALETLTRFFELYYAQERECRTLPEGFEERLKRSLKLRWDQKVQDDLGAFPLMEEELAPLSDRVRGIYESGGGLANIYGATFLAIALCEDFFLALQIGDGIILCIDEDGAYYCPVPPDEKGEMGSPASLCDEDLFTREHAFRIALSRRLPVAATVSSDGIEDSMDELKYKRFTHDLFEKLAAEEQEGQAAEVLNESQQLYLGSCLEYYAGKDHGTEDDCSLAAIYDLERPVPEIRIRREEAERLWTGALRERNRVIRDYESRKNNLLENMRKLMASPAFAPGYGGELDDRWVEAHEKLEEQKRTLGIIVANEAEKAAFYDRQMEFYQQYMEGQPNGASAEKPLAVRAVDEAMRKPDEDFLELRDLRKTFREKKKRADSLQAALETAEQELKIVVYEAKRFKGMGRGGEEDLSEQLEAAVKRSRKAEDDWDEAMREMEHARAEYRKKRDEYLGTHDVRRQNDPKIGKIVRRGMDFKLPWG